MTSILEVISYGRESILLDETFRQERPNIPGFHGTLFKYQQAEVAALIDLENNQSVDIGTQKYQFSAGVFSNPTGSGKTISLLAKILLNPIPKVNKDIICLNQCGTIHRTYKKIIRPTIVFAGVSVINQWVDAVQQFTDLKFLKVIDIRSLKTLIDCMFDGSINNFDIILVKNGTITRMIPISPFVTENRNQVGKPYIYNVIANIKMTWACVIVDDFDYIKLPKNAGRVQGLFTWFVSATKGSVPAKIYRNTQFFFSQHITLYRGMNCADIMNNPVLFKKFNIRSHSSIIQRYNRLTNPIFYQVIVNNNNAMMVNIAKNLAPEDMREIIYMMNGDAVGAAAERLGIVAKSNADIVAHLLRERYAEYKLVVNVIEFIEQQHQAPRQSFIAAGINLEEYMANPTYTDEDILARRVPAIEYPGLAERFARLLIYYQQRRTVLESAIEKVRSDLRHGDCPICMEELKNKQSCVILGCCASIGCPQCMITSCRFQLIHNDSEGRCPMCRQTVKLSQITFIDQDLRRGMEAKIEDGLDDENKENKEINEKNKEKRNKIDEKVRQLDGPMDPSKQRDKIAILSEIISGHLPFEAKEIQVVLPSLQKGSTERIPAEGFRKVLCFTDHDHAIRSIQARLSEEKIPWMYLHGTANDISKTVKQFASYQGNVVLLVNAANHCAGLNLQFVTHIVYYRKMNNLPIEEQIAGRGQRVGRTCTLEIIYLMYQSEELGEEPEQDQEGAANPNLIPNPNQVDPHQYDVEVEIEDEDDEEQASDSDDY